MILGTRSVALDLFAGNTDKAAQNRKGYSRPFLKLRGSLGRRYFARPPSEFISGSEENPLGGLR